MNISNKIILLGSLMLGSLAGCDTPVEDCVETGCQASPDKADESGSGADLGRFELELQVVGEGRVFVDGEACTTAQGICNFDRLVGAEISLQGDFSFTAQTSDDVQEGRCTSERACLVVAQHDVLIVADVESDSFPGTAPDHELAGLAPEQPGIVIDVFETVYSRNKLTLGQGGAIEN
tara:strand:+ start:48220 stop:48753 length:534 start_codon:yes stop_codon:yes gene_type:complete